MVFFLVCRSVMRRYLHSYGVGEGGGTFGEQLGSELFTDRGGIIG